MKFCVPTLHLMYIILLESRKLTNCELPFRAPKIKIGLVFAGSSLSPDLRIETISAFF